MTRAQDFPELDPGVVQAAVRAGVDRRALEETQSMVLGSKVQTKRLSEPLKPKKLNVLSESDEEEEPSTADAVGSVQPSVVPPRTRSPNHSFG